MIGSVPARHMAMTQRFRHGRAPAGRRVEFPFGTFGRLDWRQASVAASTAHFVSFSFRRTAQRNVYMPKLSLCLNTVNFRSQLHIYQSY